MGSSNKLTKFIKNLNMSIKFVLWTTAFINTETANRKLVGWSQCTSSQIQWPLGGQGSNVSNSEPPQPPPSTASHTRTRASVLPGLEHPWCTADAGAHPEHLGAEGSSTKTISSTERREQGNGPLPPIKRWKFGSITRHLLFDIKENIHEW